MYEVEQRWVEALKAIDPNLYYKWNEQRKLFEIRIKFPFSNIDNRLLLVHKNFKYKEMNSKVIEQIKENYDWEMIYENKTSDKICDAFDKKIQYYESLKEKRMEEERADYVDQHIKSFKKMQDAARSNTNKRAVKAWKRELEEDDFKKSKLPKKYKVTKGGQTNA